MDARKRYVGLDLAKRTMEVCVVKDGQSAIERASGIKTDGKGREPAATRFAMQTPGSKTGMDAGF